MEKKMTITVTSVKPGNIKGQLIAEAKARGYSVKFDVMTSIYNVEEGRKYVLEIRTSPPKDLEQYIFCGHGYVVQDILQELENPLNITVLSVWGIIFRFEPKIRELEPEQKYYVCLKPAS